MMLMTKDLWHFRYFQEFDRDRRAPFPQLHKAVEIIQDCDDCSADNKVGTVLFKKLPLLWRYFYDSDQVGKLQGGVSSSAARNVPAEADSSKPQDKKNAEYQEKIIEKILDIQQESERQEIAT
jgi:hypothetical protein